VGLAFGAFVVATGGAGLVVGAAIIGGSVAAGAGIGEVLGSLSFMGGSVSGAIASGSHDTFHNDLFAARTTIDFVACSWGGHTPKFVAQGSATVYINDEHASRKGDKIQCSAKISDGSHDVFIEGGTVTTLDLESEIPWWLHAAIFAVGALSAVILAGPIVAACGIGLSIAGGYGGTLLAQALGFGEDGQKLFGLAGSLLGGFAGMKGGARIAEIPRVAALEQTLMRPLLERSPGMAEDLARMPGRSPTQVEARTQIARDFYLRNGSTYDPTLNGGTGGTRPFNPGEENSHLRGIDFNRPVEIVEAPTNLSSYQAPGGRQGNYYSAAGVKPTELGIGDYASGSGGAPVLKTQTDYVVRQGTPALRTTARAIDDTWSIKGTPQPSDGGGTQYYIPDKAAATQVPGAVRTIGPELLNPRGPVAGAAPPPAGATGAPPSGTPP
jgi:uncharacterized Zn-binding protein involved in type VI secretion